MNQKYRQARVNTFKASFCLIFCPSGKRKCRDCVADKINAETFSEMKLSDLLQVKKKERRKRY